jgi:hypothetical protein
MLAAWLENRGIRSVATVCNVGGHREPASEHFHGVAWPTAKPAPATVLFCDDSITSGSTYERFLALCRRDHPQATVRPFFLTFDLNPRWSRGLAGLRRFRLASVSTARAPWSPSSSSTPVVITEAGDLVARMKSSSDEKLRWIAETQGDMIFRLNQKPGDPTGDDR